MATYSCTIDMACDEIFTTVFDWQMHEVSNHDHYSDIWLCEETLAEHNIPCIIGFSRRRAFERHLHEEHDVQSRGTITGCNGMEQNVGPRHGRYFYCGFCNGVIGVAYWKDPNAWWSDRIHHIGVHFRGAGLHKRVWRIEEWRFLSVRHE